MKLLAAGIAISLLAGCATDPVREEHTVFVPTEVVQATVSPAVPIVLPARPQLEITSSASNATRVKTISSNLVRLQFYARQLENLILEHNRVVQSKTTATNPSEK